MSSQNEMRKRQGGNVQPAMTRGSQHSMRGSTHSTSSSSLPRPGFSSPGAPAPRPSPGGPTPPQQRRTGPGMGAPMPYAAAGQRTSSASSFASQGSSGRPAYAAPSAYGGQYGGASNGAQAAASQSYGGYGGYSNNGGGYSSNGYGSSSQRADDKYAKKPRKHSSGGSGGSTGLAIGLGVLFVYAFILTVMYFTKGGQMNDLLKRLDLDNSMAVIQKIESLERKVKNVDSTRRSAESSARNKVSGELNRLERENKLLEEKHSMVVSDELPKAQAKIDKHNRREKAYKDQVGWLIDRTKRESKRLVLERFGPGPHKVEVTYVIPKDDNAERARYKFVIDLAPLDKVPHAVHLFLEQVDHGLLEGTHFYLNGPHIVQAGPQPDWDEAEVTDDHFVGDGSVDDKAKVSGNAIETIAKWEKEKNKKKKEDNPYDDDAYEDYYTSEEAYKLEDKRTKKFQDLGLDQLAFPDYHHEVKHTPWTIGYTGRPGGPDWYINKVDNTKGHGPGGQYQYALNEQGDSCFGTISQENDGRNHLATNVLGAEVYGDNSEWHHFISKPVEIVSAVVTTKDPILDRSIHLNHLDSQHKVYNHRRKKAQELPENTVLGDGLDPSQISDAVRDAVKNKKNVSIKKVAHRHRPQIDGAAEA